MQKIHLLITFLAAQLNLQAQQINIVKTTIVGNKKGTACKMIYPTSDGGIFWAGNTGDTAGGGDFPVCTGSAKQSNRKASGRIDANGDMVWARVYCDGLPQLPGNCLPSDDSFLIVGPGISNSSNQIVPDIYVARLDCEGNLRQQYQWGSSKADGAAIVIPASDGGFLTVGSSYGNDGDIPVHYIPSFPTSFQFRDVVAIKADSLGQKQWVKVIGSSTEDGCDNAFQVGDAFYLFVDTDGSHDYDFINSAPYPPDSSGSYLVKINGQGNLVWSRCVGSLGVNDALFDEQDSTFMIVSGASKFPPFYFNNQGNGSYTNYGLAKIDLQGQVKWAKNYGSIGYHDIPTGVCKVAGGNGYMVVGETHGETHPSPPRIGQSDGWMVWVDTLGNQIADKYFGSAEYESGIRVTNLGNRYVISTGGVYSNKPFTEGAWHYNPGVDYGVALTVIELWPTSVTEVGGRQGILEAYPNPAHDKLTILLPKEDRNYRIEVYDNAGTTVSSFQIKNQVSIVLNISSWTLGNYTVICKGTQQTWSSKVIIGH